MMLSLSNTIEHIVRSTSWRGNSARARASGFVAVILATGGIFGTRRPVGMPPNLMISS